MSTHGDHEHDGCCGGIDNPRQTERVIERRKLDVSDEEIREQAREHQDESSDLDRRSFMGGVAGAAAAGLAAPALLSDEASAHGIHEPVYTTAGLNVRSSPTTSAGIVKTAQSGTGMIIESGPYSNDGYTWWGVRVNGCGNNTSRTSGYVAADWTAHPNFSYGTWGYVSSTYWDTRDGGARYHRAIDIANDRGTALYAGRGGTVTFAGSSGGYGNLVIIDHGYGYETYYAHLDYGGIGVSSGQWVNAGDYIGSMGSTGNSSGPHLHYEIRRDGAKQNFPMVKYAQQWLNTAVPKNFPGISGVVYPGYPY